MTHYEIQPVTVQYGSSTYTATQLFTTINYTVGMVEMYCPWSICTAEGMIVWNGQAVIDQEQIDNWGEDNMYIVNIIASQAGVTLV